MTVSEPAPAGPCRPALLGSFRRLAVRNPNQPRFLDEERLGEEARLGESAFKHAFLEMSLNSGPRVRRAIARRHAAALAPPTNVTARIAKIGNIGG